MCVAVEKAQSPPVVTASVELLQVFNRAQQFLTGKGRSQRPSRVVRRVLIASLTLTKVMTTVSIPVSHVIWSFPVFSIIF